jgi:hypothetical protein
MPSDVEQYLGESTFGLPACESSNHFALSYSLGTLVTMALSAIGGYESTWSLEPMLNDGYSFKDAFQKVYGISWDSALPVLSEAVSNLAMDIFDPPSQFKYQASANSKIVTLVDNEGCAPYTPDNRNVYARIQVLQDGIWRDAPTISLSWNKDPSCDRVAGKNWLASLTVALDHGTQYRFIYVGDVNIGSRDELGRGISSTHLYP